MPRPSGPRRIPAPMRPLRSTASIRMAGCASPRPAELAPLGVGDPFLAYGSLLWVGRERLGVPPGDLESSLLLMIRLDPEWRVGPVPPLPGPGIRGPIARPPRGTPPTSSAGPVSKPASKWASWAKSGMPSRTPRAVPAWTACCMAHLAALQPELDKASGILAGEKSRRARDQLLRALG